MANYKIFEIKNGEMKMRVTSLGGAIMELYAPDAKGRYQDIALGFDKPVGYIKNSDANIGAIIGRVANRIGGGAFSLEGKKYKLSINDTSSGNHLHGGINRFNLQEWDISECSGLGWKGVVLHYLSADGEEGYPGNLDITVFYKLADDNSLVIEYNAFTDRPTLCNLTHHGYYNLSPDKPDVLDHEVKIDADFYLPISKKFLPTGEILKVAGTPLDFRKMRPLRDTVLSDSPLIMAANGGIDHSYVLKNSAGDLVYAASARDPKSGRKMDIYTTEPTLHLYTANFLDGAKGKGNAVYNKHAGFSFETQHAPDSIHHQHFPSTVLYPEDTYSSTTIYCF